MNKLTEAQYRATMAEPMMRLASDADPPCEYWNYFDGILRPDFEGHDCSACLVTHVREHPAGDFQHVLVNSEDENVFMVLVLDTRSRTVLGHRLLDLNREDGHATNLTTSRAPVIRLVTNLALLATAVLVSVVTAPMPLATLGLMDSNGAAGWTTLLVVLLALPLVAVPSLAAILSLWGLVRGPAAYRVRSLLWWTCAGCAVLAASLPRPGLNPYLDAPPPTFGFADAALGVSLLLCLLLPWVFLRRPMARHTWR